MHANNEIGTLLPIERVVQLCKKYDAYFHSDTIQGIGHYAYNLNALDADFITCAAHKFHGPKGIGFLYVNKRLKIGPFIHGGTQERSLRGGTENVVGICGLAKALELAYSDLEAHQIHIQGIKTYFMQQLSRHFNDISYHGETNPERSLYTILNVSFPLISGSGMLLFSLDLKGISASGGSACSSGAIGSSHVLTGIQADLNRPNVRFSFSKFTTREEIDRVIEILKGILPNN
jgi:cysteine desulfurase